MFTLVVTLVAVGAALTGDPYRNNVLLDVDVTKLLPDSCHELVTQHKKPIREGIEFASTGTRS